MGVINIGRIGILNQIDGGKCKKLSVYNQSTISLIKNHDYQKRSKNVALRNVYFREQYSKGRIEVVYIPSKSQLADSLTKLKLNVPTQQNLN